MFKKLQKIYLDFLLGKRSETPTYGGKLTKDTLEQLSKIIKINKLGFMTVDSQDGIRTEYGIQRSYIMGYMNKKLVKKVSEYMSVQNGIFVHAINIDKDRFYEYKMMQRKNPYDDNLDKYVYEGKFVVNIPLTIDDGKIYSSYKGMVPYGDILMMEEYINSFYEEFTEFIKNYCQIIFIDMIWDRPDYLAGKILETLGRL